MMKYRVRLLTEARLQIRDIAAYHKLKVGPESARKITNKILDAIDKLEGFPELGVVPQTKLLARAGYRMLIAGDYLCFYHIVEDTIFVSHIVHGSTDYMRHILR